MVQSSSGFDSTYLKDASKFSQFYLLFVMIHANPISPDIPNNTFKVIKD